MTANRKTITTASPHLETVLEEPPVGIDVGVDVDVFTMVRINLMNTNGSNPD
jgi:uncharacterized protein YfaQ (DUF2300 family)